MSTDYVVWIAALVIFVIAEAATAQLVTIWFAIGAAAAIVARVFGAKVGVQIAVFTVVSIVALLLTRPLAKKMTSQKAQALNADRNIGKSAVVIEKIDGVEGTGRVKLDGMEWAAKSDSGDVIEKDAVVTVKSIEGVKLIVEQTQQKPDLPVNN
ncbi:MAG: NfeD family protein [Clostridiales bacterium]|nr:NfeD family protein [Clostridiales bacterium]